jgi:ABC-2 type transport system permease protein
MAFSFAPGAYGPALVPFAGVLLLFGVALSMIVLGFVLRFGNGASILAWAVTACFMPISAVFYPVSVLPGWAQHVAAFLPTAQVFESMRTVLAGGAIPWGRLGLAFALDAVYLTGAFWFARSMFATLRRRGYVTRFM